MPFLFETTAINSVVGAGTAVDIILCMLVG